ncbi:MAG: hypothetical protein WCI51_06350 [Lentisphaerota bacterium]
MIFEGISTGTAIGLFATSGAILTGLHFLRSRYRRQPVITTMFWREALRNPQRRILPGNWSGWLAWLLTLLAALLLLLGLAEPSSTAVSTEKTVVIVDAGQPDNVYSTAVELLSATVATDPGRFAVIAAATNPILIKNFTDRFYPQRLSGISHADTTAQLDKAIYLAHTLLRDSGNSGRIAVLTPRGLTAAAANGTPVIAIVPAAAKPAAKIVTAFRTSTALELLLEQHGLTGQELALAINSPKNSTAQRFSLRPEHDGFNSFRLPVDVRGEDAVLQLELPVGKTAIDKAFPLPGISVRSLAVKLTAPVPPSLQILLESLPGIRLTANDKDADLVIGATADAGKAKLLLLDELPASITVTVWRHNDKVVAGKITPKTGFILGKSLATDASVCANPEFAASVARLIFDLAGQPLPGNIDNLEPGRISAISPLLDALPPSSLAVFEKHVAMLTGLAGWLFAAALLAFAADAYLYAKNRNP